LPAEQFEKLRKVYAGLPVCVTGGAGFIGGHLVDALATLGATITVIDDLSNSAVDHLSDLIALEPQRVRFVHASILDDEALRDATDGAAVVFHLGALGSVPFSVQHPTRAWAVNATGTLRVLEAARATGAKRVVLAASSSAYGDQATLPKVESMMARPLSPYAASKLAAEHLMLSFAKSYGLSTVSLRYFNVFGPRQPARSAYAAVVPAFTAALLAGEAPVIYGDGKQTRDMTSVGCACLATLLAGASTYGFAGEVMNVGTGRRVSLLEIAEMLAQLCGKSGVKPVFEPTRVGDVRDSLADISLAKQLLGYEPFETLEDGLKQVVAWSKAKNAE
jgi:nucleoside-diphosphate-sugar epimerase